MSKTTIPNSAQSELAALIEGSDDAIIGKKLDGTVTSWNRGATQIFGYTAAEMLGQSIYKIVPEELCAEETQILARMAKGERVPHFFTQRRCKSGELVDVSVSSSPIADSNGNIVGASKIARDVSELRRFEASLQKAKERAENTSRELEAFSYSVAHDLRAPLRTIDGFSQILLEDYAGKFDDTARAHFERIRNASQRMGQLIDDLLKLAHISRKSLNRTMINLGQLAADLIENLRVESPDRNVTVLIGDNLVVHGDSRLLAIVMGNLLANAWKFTGKRDVARIEIGMEAQAGKNVYFVRDNGAGFDMAYSNKLFTVFQRLHRGDEFEGTGIGLVTVKRIVEHHGGRIWAEGQVGVGATFYFTIGQTD